jgi:hypothetical protein
MDRNVSKGHTASILKAVVMDKYSSDHVSAGNTFQDLPQLRDTADNTERYILRDIRVTNINTAKFNFNFRTVRFVLRLRITNKVWGHAVE